MAEDEEERVLDTIVVGGGIAGLTAAYRLRDRDILLLEKEEIPGGRTVSRKLGPYVYNAGAQVILGDTSPLARLADELDVKRTLIAKSKLPFFTNGKLYSASGQIGLLRKLPMSLADKLRFAWFSLRLKRKYGSLADKPFDPKDPKIIELNSTTVDQFLGSVPQSVRDLWEVFAVVATTTGGDVVTPYHPLMVLLFFLEDEYFVEGGTNQLTIALCRMLGEKAKLGAEVVEVKEMDDRVQVTYDLDGARKTAQARHCIMATQAPITLKVVQDLPDWKRDALARMEYGSMTTAAFLLSEPSERFLGKGVWRVPVQGQMICALTDPSYTYPREFKEETGQGLLRVYTGDKVSKELMGRSDGEVAETLIDDLVAMLPQIKGKVLESDVAHWYHAAPLWKPGHDAIYSNLQAPTGRIHYCGDYTGPGFMNGSVLTAYRVVEEIEKAQV